MITNKVTFPKFTGIRCLMMPYIQGDSASIPDEFSDYSDILEKVFIKKGDVGYLTIDESLAVAGRPHRGDRAKTDRALHTEVGRLPNMIYKWGGGGWGGGKHLVTLDRDVQVLLANNADNTCALWDTTHENTSDDGDIGYASVEYPYKDSVMMKAGEVHKIGILTPHESLPVKETFARQFLIIISSGVHGREPYFTVNPLFAV